MTELQLKIRKLVHKMSALKKAGKSTDAIAAELTPLREQRKAERAIEKKEKADKKAEAPANA